MMAGRSGLLKGGPAGHRLRRREAPLTSPERPARWPTWVLSTTLP